VLAHRLRRKSGAAVLTSLTFVASAVSNANTITIPAGAQAGDLAVLFDKPVGTVSGSDPPTNWTSILGAGGTNGLAVSRKLLVGGDPGASVTGITGSGNSNKVMFVFRPDAPITTVTASTWGQQITANNPTPQTVSASGQPTPLVVFGGAGVTSGTAAFSTASPAFDSTVANAAGLVIAGYKIYNSSPADHSIDMNDLGNNALVSGYLRVA
jgi:hypothetical protein